MIEYKIDSYLKNIDKNAIEGEISTHKRVVSIVSIKNTRSEIMVHRNEIMRIAKEIDVIETFLSINDKETIERLDKLSRHLAKNTPPTKPIANVIQ